MICERCEEICRYGAREIGGALYCVSCADKIVAEAVGRFAFALEGIVMAPSTVDVGTITEYGLTQKLSAPIRCF